MNFALLANLVQLAHNVWEVAYNPTLRKTHKTQQKANKSQFLLFLRRKVPLAKPGYFFSHYIYLTSSPLTLALESFSSIPEQKQNTSTQEWDSADEGLYITI